MDLFTLKLLKILSFLLNISLDPSNLTTPLGIQLNLKILRHIILADLKT